MKNKPTMFIAEDSERLAALYESVFAKDFTVVVALNGIEALAAIDEHEGFDICIVDSIMPIEHPDSLESNQDMTGVRLIEAIIEQGKSRRILMLTVRWDLREKLADVIGARAEYRLVVKQRATKEDIVAAVAELMATP